MHIWVGLRANVWEYYETTYVREFRRHIRNNRFSLALIAGLFTLVLLQKHKTMFQPYRLPQISELFSLAEQIIKVPSYINVSSPTTQQFSAPSLYWACFQLSRPIFPYLLINSQEASIILTPWGGLPVMTFTECVIH